MTGFGDDEPEDGWHPDDPLPVLVANLIRRRERDFRGGRTPLRDRMFDDDLQHVLDRIKAELIDEP